MLFPASAFLKLALTWYCLQNDHLDTQAIERGARVLNEEQDDG